ncbi:MAG: ACT domain-containing protein [Thiotrichaceae bacterium]
MSQWFMLTLVGKDQPGIVAKVTAALYQGGCNLGEASMLRLGGNFTIMLMLSYSGSAATLEQLLAPVVNTLQLRLHIDEVEAQLRAHCSPDVAISVYGADRAGIVAQVTEAFANAGLNILNLETDVGGETDKPFYIMQIEGTAQHGIEKLESALQTLLTVQKDLKVHITAIDTAVM